VPERWTRNEQRQGIDFHEMTLLEHSYVTVPANAEALVALRSAGGDEAALRSWFGGTPSRRDATPALVLELSEDDADEDLVLQLDVEDDGATFCIDPSEIPQALREVVDEAVQAALRRADEAFDDVDLTAALREAVRDLPALVGAECQRQIRLLTGRVD
jgi:hypothetical protein